MPGKGHAVRLEKYFSLFNQRASAPLSPSVSLPPPHINLVLLLYLTPWTHQIRTLTLTRSSSASSKVHHASKLTPVGKNIKPGKSVQLREEEIRFLCVRSREIFLGQPILLELEAPIKVCGTAL